MPLHLNKNLPILKLYMKHAIEVASGLYFGESPRYHEDKLWFSDFFDEAVWTLDEDFHLERVFEVKNQPSGLGWLPDGRMLVVSMLDRKVLRREGDELVEHADLWDIFAYHANDMLVDIDGTAYVGNFGFDVYTAIEEEGLESLVLPPGPTTANIAKITPSGEVSVVADELFFPNGMAITPDRKSFVVAETLAMRLTAYDLDENGDLKNRRIFADLKDQYIAPDGIAMDEEGMIWVANSIGPEVVRVKEGGEIVDRIRTADSCFSCTLGGKDGKTLYAMCTPSRVAFMEVALQEGKIFTYEVDVKKAET